MIRYILPLIFMVLSDAMVIHAQNKITALDVHSHIVTDEYLKYLADNDALMEDGYPLPFWDEKTHLAFMLRKETTIEPRGLLVRYIRNTKSKQTWIR